MKRVAVLLSLVALATGCAAPTLYSWGRYENLVYGIYAAPEKVPPQVQLTKLSEDLEKANTAKRAVPPGVLAHMGLLYVQLGQKDLAVEHFEAEKNLFPESSVLMDRLISNLTSK